MKTRNWWSRLLVFGVSACVVLLVVACQQPAPPAAVDRETPVTEPAVQEEVEEETLVSEGQMDVVDEPVAEPPAMPEPVAEPPAMPEPVAEPPAMPEPVIEPISAIPNGSFEKWGMSGPSGWRTLDADSAVDVAVVQCKDTPHGSLGVKFVPAEARSAISQPLVLPAEFAGKTVRLSAAINSSEEGMTKVNLYYMLDGSRQTVMLEDQGTGEWTVSKAMFTMPPNADLESFEILIGLREGAKEASCVDDLRLEIVE